MLRRMSIVFFGIIWGYQPCNEPGIQETHNVLSASVITHDIFIDGVLPALFYKRSIGHALDDISSLSCVNHSLNNLFKTKQMQKKLCSLMHITMLPLTNIERVQSLIQAGKAKRIFRATAILNMFVETSTWVNDPQFTDLLIQQISKKFRQEMYSVALTMRTSGAYEWIRIHGSGMLV